MLPQFRLRKRKEPEVRVHSPAPVSAGAVRGLVFLLAEALVGLVLLGLALIFVLDRSNFRSPAMARVLADKLSETLEDRGFEIESVSFQLARADRFAGMTAYGVKLLDKNDNVLIAVPAVEVEFTLADLLRGEIRPLRLEVIGAEANLLRNEKGRISLTLGGKPNRLGGTDAGLDGGGLERLVTGSENLANVPELSRLTEIAISNASVGYHDVVSGRDWQAESGFMVLRSQDEGYSASLKGRLLQPGSKDAVISVIATQNSDSGDTHVDFRVANVSPKDLASEFQALEWMRLLDAPVQANLLLDVSAAGELLAFSGGLDVGSGVVAAAGTAPVPFTSARARFAYDPTTATFEIPTLTLDTGAASLQSAGSMQLVRDDAGHLTSLVTQLDLRDIRLDPAGMFEQPVGWPEGRAAVKVVLEPFTVTLGELVFFGDGTHVSLKGDIAAREAGWHYGLEMDAAGLSKDDLLRLWPVRLAQKARAWVAENVRTGQITQMNAAIRPGATRPSFVMQFEFDRARVRVVRFMPDVTEASGYGELNEKSFELNFLQGTIAEDGKGGVSVAGTRFHVPQFRMRPAPATVELNVDGELQPILALVNRDPLNLLDKAGIDPEVVAGHGAAKARLNFLMRKGLPLSNVGYDLTASLTRVASDRLVRGRSIAADEVTLRAADRQIKLEGKATLDGMPVDFAWSRALGRDAPDDSVLSAILPLDAASLATLGVTLPEGSIGGRSEARLDLRLSPGQAPAFTLEADLAPLDLRIAALDWSKAAGAEGSASVSGRLTDPMSLDQIRIDGPGLSAIGRVDLEDGVLTEADFKQIQLSPWLEAGLNYLPGEGRVDLIGGRVDLRGRSGQGGGNLRRINLRETDIAVTETISLLDASGALVAGSPMEGEIAARVNGGASVTARLSADGGDQRIAVTGADAGAVLRDAGLFRNAYGGSLKLNLVQTGRGAYRGSFVMHDLRVQDAPALAKLLSAASIIGFLEQLDGKGLLFTTVSGSFTLADGMLTLTEAKAVGPSMGISAAGQVRPVDGQFALNGVISPLYAVNGLFEKLPVFGRLLGGKDGEGLIGFTYTLQGNAQDHQVTVNPLSMLTPGALRELIAPQTEMAPSQ